MDVFKMEANTLLINSNLCRLCCEENSNGIDIYTIDENADDLCSLVNRYLPVKVENGDPFPKTICPGCHIQLEATKLFMDLIIDGQEKLRNLLKVQQDLYNREEKERKKLEQALQNHNPKASVETYTIKSDESGEKFIIQIYSKGPLFSPEHQLSLKAEGLSKPKRKRGRPPKNISNEATVYEIPSEEKDTLSISAPSEALEPTPEEDPNQRQKRKIRPPARYEGGVQGKELVKILKKEGVIDEDVYILDDEIIKNEDNFNIQQKSDPPKTVIGKVVASDGSEVEKLVFMKTRPSNKRIKKKNTTKQKFSCDICKKEFQHYGRCEMHKRSHKIKYACQQADCSVQDENRGVIVVHQQATGHEGISAFEQINKINGTVILANNEEEEEELIKEIITSSEKEQEDTLLKCDKCFKSFSCKQNYEVHLKAIHDGERPFKCKVCKKAFAYACSLKNHMIVHKLSETSGTVDGYNCDSCEKIFQHPSSLMYHKDTEHGNRRFICNKCNKSFKHRQLLLRHQLVHSEERPFKCNVCSRQFKSKTSLVNHENVHKGIKKFICPICGNRFLHKTSLWVHLKWHDGNKPYECDVCKKNFSQKGNLLEHQRIHTGEKPFTCDLCGRSFTTSSQCKLHMKRHTGEKPHSCKYCQRQFLHKDTYEAHIRRHLGERPFHCKFCTKAFPEQWACTRHERIHMGLKKYKCEVCNKDFSDGANFTKHKKIHFKKGIKPEILDDKLEANEEQVIATQIANVDIQFLPVEVEEQTEKATETNAPDLHIHSLLDQEGNTISITTADGHPIPIVSSDNDKFQGLLPDGTLVSFDILSNEQHSKTQEGAVKGEEDEEPTQIESVQEVNLLNTEIQFLEENSITNVDESLSQAKPGFMSEDGKVCFITTFDENSFLTMN